MCRDIKTKGFELVLNNRVNLRNALIKHRVESCKFRGYRNFWVSHWAITHAQINSYLSKHHFHLQQTFGSPVTSKFKTYGL